MTTTSFESQVSELLGAPPRARVAFATACAARTVRVFEEYWEGDHSEAPSRALECGWAFATGTPVDAALEAYRSEIARFIRYYHEEGLGNLASALTSVLRVIECITAANDLDSATASTRAAASALDVASRVDGFLLGRPAHGKGPTLEEERRWQSATLQELRESSSDRAQVALQLRASTLTPPPWWPAYVNAQRHV